MYIEFDKEYLQELYTEGKTSDKKHRYQPEVVKGYQKAVSALRLASGIEVLYQLHSLIMKYCTVINKAFHLFG